MINACGSAACQQADSYVFYRLISRCPHVKIEKKVDVEGLAIVQGFLEECQRIHGRQPNYYFSPIQMPQNLPLCWICVIQVGGEVAVGMYNQFLQKHGT